MHHYASQLLRATCGSSSRSLPPPFHTFASVFRFCCALGTRASYYALQKAWKHTGNYETT